MNSNQSIQSNHRSNYSSEQNIGSVISVRSSIVDVHFPKQLPDLYNKLETGKNGEIAIEVVSHLSEQVARGVALAPTAGLERGEVVIDTQHPLQVPVSDRLLGRMLNLFGEAIDGKEPISGGELRSIHATPIAMSERVTKDDILKTGLKAIGNKEQRKIHARETDPYGGVWFGLGFTGLVGWSTVAPTMLGMVIGAWLDRQFPSQFPSQFSWTLSLMLGGLTLGCLVAWEWVSQEQERIAKSQPPDDDSL